MLGASLLVTATAASAATFVVTNSPLSSVDNGSGSVFVSRSGTSITYQSGRSVTTESSPSGALDLGFNFTITGAPVLAYVDAQTTPTAKNPSAFAPGAYIYILDDATKNAVTADYTFGLDTTTGGTSANTGGTDGLDAVKLGPGTYTEVIAGTAKPGTTDLNVGVFTSAVPEPATWALMLAGVAMMGAALRQRRRPVQAGATAA